MLCGVNILYFEHASNQISSTCTKIVVNMDVFRNRVNAILDVNCKYFVKYITTCEGSVWNDIRDTENELWLAYGTSI